METHYVTTIAVQERAGSPTWLKSLCGRPNPEDIEFYYKTLCGFKDAVVTVTTELVPADFTESLLALGDAEPTEFPSFPLVAETEERKAEYYNYIKQLCEMERSRSRMAVGRLASAGAAGSIGSAVARGRSTGGQRKWVAELLATLGGHTVRETTAAPHGHTARETTPTAWLLTPTAARTRADRGSRLLTDAAVGLHWEQKLGTDLYPDFVVSRRLTTASWAFQHPSSSSLLSSVVAWLEAQHPSGWLRDAEAVVDGLLRPFATAFVGTVPPAAEREAEELCGKDDGRDSKDSSSETSETSEGSDGSEGKKKTPSIHVLLQRIEATMLHSKAEVPEVDPLSVPLFTRLVDYMARSFGIPKETYVGSEAVAATLQRWTQSQMGFSLKTKPLLSSWQEVWDLIMGTRPSTKAKGKREKAVTATRVSHLVETMDVWDVCEGALMSEDVKKGLWDNWLSVFCDYELGNNKGAKIPLTAMEDAATAFLQRFLPRLPFASLQRRFRDCLTTALLRKGYATTMVSGALMVVGARILTAVTPAPVTPTAVTVLEALADRPPPLNTVVMTDEVVDLGTF
jgi:hypothetical protein